MGWTYTEDAKRGKGNADVVAHLVKNYGAERVGEWVKQAADELERQKALVNLPDGYEWFTEGDWMGFAGAERFGNGLRPVIGSLDLDLPGKEGTRVVVKDFPVVLSGEGKDMLGCLAGVSGVTVSEEESEDGGCYMKSFKSLTEAVEFFRMLRELPQALTIERLVALGFDRVN